jgi:hypothetical protein
LIAPVVTEQTSRTAALVEQGAAFLRMLGVAADALPLKPPGQAQDDRGTFTSMMFRTPSALLPSFPVIHRFVIHAKAAT